MILDNQKTLEELLQGHCSSPITVDRSTIYGTDINRICSVRHLLENIYKAEADLEHKATSMEDETSKYFQINHHFEATCKHQGSQRPVR